MMSLRCLRSIADCKLLTRPFLSKSNWPLIILWTIFGHLPSSVWIERVVSLSFDFWSAPRKSLLLDAYSQRRINVGQIKKTNQFLSPCKVLFSPPKHLKLHFNKTSKNIRKSRKTTIHYLSINICSMVLLSHCLPTSCKLSKFNQDRHSVLTEN